jgi:mRNA deadenylase 3'-5' endonuclease subunit Ccr4
VALFEQSFKLWYYLSISFIELFLVLILFKVLKFGVMQWNILADSLATPDSFPFVDPQLLLWEQRQQKIVQVFDQCGQDIIGVEVGKFSFTLSS